MVGQLLNVIVSYASSHSQNPHRRAAYPARVTGCPPAQVCLTRGEGQGAASRHRFAGLDGQVEQRLLHLPAIGQETGGAVGGNTIYRGYMGRLLLLVLAVIAGFMVLSIVISALHFIFWVAVVALIVVGALRLSGGARRRARR